VPEASVALSAVLKWLEQTDRETATALVVGCELDDGDSEQAALIAGLEWSDAARAVALVLDDGRRVPVRRLVAKAQLVDPRAGAPLARAVDASRSPAETAEREMRRVLGNAGIDPDRLRSPDARRAVAVFAWKLDRGRLPSADERQAAYMAFISHDAALERRGKVMLGRLVALCGVQNLRIPDDLWWRLASLARHTGDLREAIAVSDILHRPDRPRDEICRKLLAMTRCAALIDLWDVNAQPELLRQAEQAFKVARAIGSRDEEVDNLHWRLRRALERAGIR
jgi:hypothetical protein